MKQKIYPQLKKTLYYATLDNGLKLFVIPKPHFHKTFMSLNVGYGSIDNTFIPFDQTSPISLPAGVAHFLEHKMFDKKDYNVDDLFNQLGAETNAFTSFTDTNYVVETIDHVEKVLNILLDFVQIPYFTAEKVAKERGIIEQEIKMYQDDPEAELYFKTIRNLYPHFPLNQDVAGSVDSIRQITVDDLYLAHRNFYQPANMRLVIVGDVDAENISTMVINNQQHKQLLNNQFGHAVFEKEDALDIQHWEQSDMGLSQPKVSIGVKGMNPMGTGHDNLRHELELELLINLLLSDHTKINAEMYKQGIIDDSFTYELENERQFHFLFIASDTDRPQAFVKQIKQTLLTATQTLKGKNNDLQLIKREMIGNRIMQGDSLERLALGVGNRLNNYANLYDEIQMLNEIQLPSLIKMAQAIFKEPYLTVNIIK